MRKGGDGKKGWGGRREEGTVEREGGRNRKSWGREGRVEKETERE